MLTSLKSLRNITLTQISKALGFERCRMPNTISDKIRGYYYSPLGRLKYQLVMTTIAILLPFALASCDVITSNVSDTEVTEIPVSSDNEELSDGSVDKSGLPKVVPSDKPLTPPSEVPEELNVIWEVWAHLVRDHVDKSTMDPKLFSEAAIKGIIGALGDPHTHYVSAETFEIDNQDLQGNFEGIGANVTSRLDGKLVIVSPIKGGPAEQAGIRPGDIILEVDGEDISGLSLLEAVTRIRGPRGTAVSLLVQHLGEIDPVEIIIHRDVIPLISVLTRSEPGDRIAHIRVTDFYADTAQRLYQALIQATNSGAEGLILDVRDNPGGLLSSAITVTSIFLDDGLALYDVDGSGTRTNHHLRNTGGVGTTIPMVVLANEYSASASEILIGAIQDRDRATVVGATTFGKGSVGILRRLNNGAGLFMTTSRWYTPSGRLIQGIGLEPDIEITTRNREEAESQQLEKAFEILEQKLD